MLLLPEIRFKTQILTAFFKRSFVLSKNRIKYSITLFLNKSINKFDMSGKKKCQKVISLDFKTILIWHFLTFFISAKTSAPLVLGRKTTALLAMVIQDVHNVSRCWQSFKLLYFFFLRKITDYTLIHNFNATTVTRKQKHILLSFLRRVQT